MYYFLIIYVYILFFNNIYMVKNHLRKRASLVKKLSSVDLNGQRYPGGVLM